MWIYAQSLFRVLVCGPENMEPEEVERKVNEEFPTGLEHRRWVIEGDEPNKCDAEEGCLHYQLSC